MFLNPILLWGGRSDSNLAKKRYVITWVSGLSQLVSTASEYDTLSDQVYDLPLHGLHSGFHFVVCLEIVQNVHARVTIAGHGNG